MLLLTVANWNLLSNHGLVLLCVARHPGMRLREIGDCVGITERAAQRIVCDLCDEGYLCRRKAGRRNTYEVRTELPLRHPSFQDRRVCDLLGGLVEPGAGKTELDENLAKA